MCVSSSLNDTHMHCADSLIISLPVHVCTREAISATSVIKPQQRLFRCLTMPALRTYLSYQFRDRGVGVTRCVMQAHRVPVRTHVLQIQCLRGTLMTATCAVQLARAPAANMFCAANRNPAKIPGLITTAFAALMLSTSPNSLAIEDFGSAQKKVEDAAAEAQKAASDAAASASGAVESAKKQAKDTLSALPNKVASLFDVAEDKPVEELTEASKRAVDSVLQNTQAAVKGANTESQKPGKSENFCGSIASQPNVAALSASSSSSSSCVT
jgi:hypothetical protein